MTEALGDEHAARMSELAFLRIENRHVLEERIVIVEENRGVLRSASDLRDSFELLCDPLDRALHRRNENISLTRRPSGDYEEVLAGDDLVRIAEPITQCGSPFVD